VTQISVIVPAYNVERFLPATLESIIAQTFEDWECVVVDDASTDGTLTEAERLAAADPRIRVLPVRHGGVSAARNAGMRASDPKAPYVTFMDADDVWIPGALDTLVGLLRENPDAIGAHGVADFIDESGRPLQPGEFAERGRRRPAIVNGRLEELSLAAPTGFSTLIAGTAIFPPGLLLVRREAYCRAGAFDETLAAGEDWEMLVRLSRLGDFTFTPDILVGYRRHATNAGASSMAPAQAHYAYCQAFHSRLNSPAQRRTARQAWRINQQRRMADLWREARSGPTRNRPAVLARMAVTAVRLAEGRPRPVVRRDPPPW